MRRIIIKLHVAAKGIILLLRPHVLFGWLRHPLRFASNTLALSRWIAAQRKDPEMLNDFYTFTRDHKRREDLHAHVIERLGLADVPLDYVEFGVFDGRSFRWWMAHARHTDSRFHGFDTFEGLPEAWGGYAQGEMSSPAPKLDDARGQLYKGLFQDTLPPFLAQKPFRDRTRKVIHLDADLYSSTLMALTSLAPHLRTGDVLLFDEFNVPDHEFRAFTDFQEAYRVRTEMLGAVNNYYQVALKII